MLPSRNQASPKFQRPEDSFVSAQEAGRDPARVPRRLADLRKSSGDEVPKRGSRNSMGMW